MVCINKCTRIYRTEAHKYKVNKDKVGFYIIVNITSKNNKIV